MKGKTESAFEALKDKIEEVRSLERKLTQVLESDPQLTPQDVGDWIILIQGRCRLMLRQELRLVYDRYPTTLVEAYERHGSPYNIVLDFVVSDDR